MDNGEHFLKTVEQTLAAQKDLADRAIAQLDTDDFHWTPHEESNSIAVIVKHVAGNMRSRWTDFLTTDGEKPNRNRDGEFVDDLGSAEQVLAVWEEGWSILFTTLATLRPQHLQQMITIRRQERTVTDALLNQLGHYAQHVGQIVYLAKLRLGANWQTVSIPKRRA
jgi:uncharacterized damage-inducible protein DinB